MLELIGKVGKIIVTRTYRWDYKVLNKYKVVTYVNYSRVELERKLNLLIHVVDIFFNFSLLKKNRSLDFRILQTVVDIIELLAVD